MGRRISFAPVLPLLAAAIGLAQQPASAPFADRPRLHTPAPVNANTKTGPAVGSKIPAFDLIDQNGKHQTLATLRGPKGLVLAFIRSADW